MEKTYKEYLEEILCSKVSDDLTGDQKQALDAVTELLGFCDYERLCELAKLDKEGICSLSQRNIEDIFKDKNAKFMVFPVKEAKWIDLRKDDMDCFFQCSNCGKKLGMPDEIETPLEIGIKYCSNCGAKMDGEERWNATTN